ncbi:zinc-dependent metalloprotease [Chitinophagaceae bacterium MMS25-I14]
MKKLLLASAGLCIFSFSAIAQNQFTRSCGAESLKKHFFARHPENEQTYKEQRETMLQDAAAYETQKFSTAAKTAKATQQVTIPVVFHIVLTSAQITQLGGTAGIVQRIDSQMAVINRDFNRKNSDSTQIYTGFKPNYGNMQIKFALAHTTPSNHSTPGYEIITTTQSGFSESGSNGGDGFPDAKYTSSGGADAWNTARYLNIWVINMSGGGGLLGLTVPLSLTSPQFIDPLPVAEVGIALNYQAFGKKAGPLEYYPLSGIDGGRTLTHELGHMFELNHVWGDDGGLCPNNGGADDGISDTPPQASETYGSPAAPKYDGCTAAGNGIMFMNFMDYVDDAAMHMFTNGQANLAQLEVSSSGESHELTTHPEILNWPTSVANIENNSNIAISPNPATTNITISVYNPSSPLKSIAITDITGRQVTAVNDMSVTNTYNIDLSGLSKGVYFVQCRFEEGMTSRKIVLQ